MKRQRVAPTVYNATRNLFYNFICARRMPDDNNSHVATFVITGVPYARQHNAPCYHKNIASASASSQ